MDNNSFQRELYHRVVAKCWADPEFKSRLLANPKAVLTAEGFSLSEGSTIRVIDAARDEVLFLIPYHSVELSDDQLGYVTGGSVLGHPSDFPYPVITPPNAPSPLLGPPSPSGLVDNTPPGMTVFPPV